MLGDKAAIGLRPARLDLSLPGGGGVRVAKAALTKSLGMRTDRWRQVGLDQYQVRSWNGWHRHTTLALLALAWSYWRRHHQAVARACHIKRHRAPDQKRSR